MELIRKFLELEHQTMLKTVLTVIKCNAVNIVTHQNDSFTLIKFWVRSKKFTNRK